MLSLPEEFNEGIRQCTNGDGKFEFPRWGAEGLSPVAENLGVIELLAQL